MKKTLLFTVVMLLFHFVFFGQCSYTGAPLTQAGATVTFCIDGPNPPAISTNAGNYVLINVVKGYNYTFSIPDIASFAGNENLTIYDAANMATPLDYNSGASGTTITWQATLSGQIKLLLSKGVCINDGTAGGSITFLLNTTGISFVNTPPATLCIGTTFQLTPSTGGTWSSSNPSVASVNATGLITAISEGTGVKFTIEIAGNCTATTSAISVNNVIGGVITASSAGVQSPACGGPINPSTTLNTTPATGSGTISYQWQSSTDNAAFINISGKTTATYAFTGGFAVTSYFRRVATSTLNGVACSANSNTLTYIINVLPTVASITSATSVSICPGNTVQLFDATSLVKNIWSSGNNLFATVNSTGLVTGLALGAGNSVTISYTVTDSNGCSKTANKTVKIIKNNTITLSSVTGTDSQTICENATLTSITYTTTGATNATYSGLPTGVTGSFLLNKVTISGSPNVAGTFNYTINLIAGCGAISAFGSITANAKPTATITGGGKIYLPSTFPTVTVALTGTSPWSIMYTNGNPISVSGILTSPYTFTPSTAGNFTLTSVSDANCTGTFSGNALVASDITKPTISCPANQTVLGCSTTMIIDNIYSTNAVSISPEQFVVLGGSFSDDCSVTNITYQDSSAGTCPIVVTRSWKAFDGAGNVSTLCNQIINIENAPIIMNADGASTVAFIGLAIEPSVSSIIDNCGTTLNAVLVSKEDTSNSLTCEGIRTYNYTFTDCSGLVSNWKYIYTTEHTTAVIVPINEASTVECFTLATIPKPPTNVVDKCGTIIKAVLVSTIDTPNSTTCEGIRTYNYTFTDYLGLVYNWKYTYTIERKTAALVPKNKASTVECFSLATEPTPPTSVVDKCGTTINAVLVSTIDIPNLTSCEGSRSYNYTFTDCSGFISNWKYTYTIERKTAPLVPKNKASTVECFSLATEPTPPTSVVDKCGTTITAVLASTIDITNSTTCEGSRSYNYTFTDCSGFISNWKYTYTIERKTAALVPKNKASTVECFSLATEPTPPTSLVDKCGTTITAVLISTIDIPNSTTCKGSRTYNYTFTDCSGLVSNWKYTYTIITTIAPTGTELENFTFQCMEDIPVADVNAISDLAGNCNGKITVTVEDINNGESGYSESPYILTRIYTLTNCSGLSSKLFQTIIVADTIAPELTSELETQLSASCNQIPAVPVLSFADNCSAVDAINVNYKESNSTPENGNYFITRKWKVSDSWSNYNTFVQTINVTINDYLVQYIKQACSLDLATINLDTLVSSSYKGKGTWVDINSVGGLKDAIFSPYHMPNGYYVMEYQMNSKYCPRSIEVTLAVNDDCAAIPDIECEVAIFNAISQNEDAKNDVFYIQGLECYPDNSVKIYNRWGILIFESTGYNNKDKAFRGISEGLFTYKQSKELPVGTYYYLLKYTNRKNLTMEKTGYIYLNR